jgi:leader peptidase (prepilin peptidase)/N-methyltransferase
MADLLATNPWLLLLLCLLLGLAVGSFLNVVIHRLPIMLERQWQAECAALRGEYSEPPGGPYNLLFPRSACPQCGHPISALENIPLISYLMLGGKCRQCHAPISPRYPVVELATGLLSVLVAWRFGFTLTGAMALALAWALIALTFIDLDTQLLPDSLTQPLLWLGLLANFQGMFTTLPAAVIGAMAGYLSLWSVYWAFKLATGKEGMGHGDFKLLAALGAWLGWQMIPVVILLSSVVGAAVGIALIVFVKHDRRMPIPFGPYLAGGGVIALVWGDQLLRWYLPGIG